MRLLSKSVLGFFKSIYFLLLSSKKTDQPADMFWFPVFKLEGKEAKSTSTMTGQQSTVRNLNPISPAGIENQGCDNKRQDNICHVIRKALSLDPQNAKQELNNDRQAYYNGT